MGILVEQKSQVLHQLDISIKELQSRLEPFKNMDELNEIIDIMIKKIKSIENTVIENKKRKLQRDQEDYKNGQIRPPRKNNNQRSRNEKFFSPRQNKRYNSFDKKEHFYPGPFKRPDRGGKPWPKQEVRNPTRQYQKEQEDWIEVKSRRSRQYSRKDENDKSFTRWTPKTNDAIVTSNRFEHLKNHQEQDVFLGERPLEAREKRKTYTPLKRLREREEEEIEIREKEKKRRNENFWRK
ncbi:Hypothetical predicted protein [Pelobates cultripes]|uniref:Uncharacterized protein n=1 Tax=Pelobates cultripes TaxID=61616 RepID=A0AAD1TCI7_PELCU|nr:Hypothetical predicted protein [Pelobates cultripes]